MLSDRANANKICKATKSIAAFDMLQTRSSKSTLGSSNADSQFADKETKRGEFRVISGRDYAVMVIKHTCSSTRNGLAMLGPMQFYNSGIFQQCKCFVYDRSDYVPVQPRPGQLGQTN